MSEPENKKERRGRLVDRLRGAGWALRERLIWPAADLFRDGFDAAKWPFERLAWAIRKRVFWPLQDLLTSPAGGRAKVPRLATVGAIGALALGSLGAGALVASGSGEPAADEGAVVVAEATQPDPTPDPEEITPILAKTEPEPDGPVLKGVRPSFGAKSDEERRAARAALRKLKAERAEAGDSHDAGDGSKQAEGGDRNPADTDQEQAGDAAEQAGNATTDDETSTDDGETVDPASGATASNANVDGKRLKESPLSVAERFAVAFVSYEIGATGRPVNKVFRDTAQKDLFAALRKRPPRQPAGGKVPRARVMNVVGGPRKKQAMEVSVGLLRVDGVSELRLEMEKIERGWVVKTVRG